MREIMVKQPLPTPTLRAAGICPSIIQISRTPRNWKQQKECVQTIFHSDARLKVAKVGSASHEIAGFKHLNYYEINIFDVYQGLPSPATQLFSNFGFSCAEEVYI